MNFVREQRWPLLTLLLYVCVFGGGIALFGSQSEDDTLFMLRSTSMYGLAFAGLLSASALNNERRTRRILAVLSKGISRSEYLAGLLLGAMLASAVYCGTIFAVGVLATHRIAILMPFAAMLMVLFLLAAATALAFSTVFHPLLASAAAGLLLGAEGLLARALGGIWLELLPSLLLVDRAVNFGEPGWHAPWVSCVAAVIQAGVFWSVANAIFSRRDIAVAIE